MGDDAADKSADKSSDARGRTQKEIWDLSYSMTRSSAVRRVQGLATAYPGMRPGTSAARRKGAAGRSGGRGGGVGVAQAGSTARTCGTRRKPLYTTAYRAYKSCIYIHGEYFRYASNNQLRARVLAYTAVYWILLTA